MPRDLLELAPYLAGLAGVGLALFLFLEMRRIQREFQVRWARRQQALHTELGKLRCLVQDLTARVDDAERRAAVLVPPPAAPSGMNLNRRTHAIRLIRRGHTPEQVAAALGISSREAGLLEKAHRLAASGTASGYSSNSC
ncbi:MAG: hypothetical protein HY235_05580 [Acidobacteria bacterium]|nr:hypothetical protein [Acidobacteriota bacterium]